MRWYRRKPLWGGNHLLLSKGICTAPKTALTTMPCRSWIGKFAFIFSISSSSLANNNLNTEPTILPLQSAKSKPLNMYQFVGTLYHILVPTSNTIMWFIHMFKYISGFVGKFLEPFTYIFFNGLKPYDSKYVPKSSNSCEKHEDILWLKKWKWLEINDSEYSKQAYLHTVPSNILYSWYDSKGL